MGAEPTHPILLADPSANVTAVWLGVMIGLIVQTSFLTPPFGFSLFYLRAIAPSSIGTIHIYKGVAPFIAIQLLTLGIVGIFPVLVNYVPNRVLLLSDKPTPPTNPRMQYCIEQFVDGRFANSGDTIRRAISRAGSLDLSILPPHLRQEFQESLVRSEAAFTLMGDIKKSEREILDAAVRYRPLHRTVRGIEREARQISGEVTKLEELISRSGGHWSQRAARKMQDQRAKLIVRSEALLAQIPSEWAVIYKDFSSKRQKEIDARRAYRRAVDGAYQPIEDVLAMIRDVKKLDAMYSELGALKRMVSSAPPPMV